MYATAEIDLVLDEAGMRNATWNRHADASNCAYLALNQVNEKRM
jgi:hypothetical protein